MNACKPWIQRAAVAVAMLLLCASAGAAMAAGPKSDGYDFPRVEALTASYPDDCSGEKVQQGLCLLGSRQPRAATQFLVRLVATSAAPAADGMAAPPYRVKLNKRLALAPGVYELFREDGTDDFHEARFEVTAGQVFTLKTATLRFDGGRGMRYQLQHFMARSNADDRGCESLVKVAGVEAVLPGTYRVALQRPGPTGAVPVAESLGRPQASDAPRCRRDGVSFHVIAGEAVELSVGKIEAEQLLTAWALPQGHIYRHPTGALALTSVGSFRHEVTHVGLVPGFKSFHGMHNPSDEPVDALVLWGPNAGFAIPMRVNATASCGLSLAKGGLPERNLLTQCEFDDEGRLTAFRINSRAYFGYTNVNGQSEPGAHTINDPVLVRGLSWISNNREGD